MRVWDLQCLFFYCTFFCLFTLSGRWVSFLGGICSTYLAGAFGVNSAPDELIGATWIGTVERPDADRLNKANGRRAAEGKAALTIKQIVYRAAHNAAELHRYDIDKLNALNRMCVNPMQDKVNNIRTMALDVQTEFEAAVADRSKPNAGSKALIKLRGELVRLYTDQQKLAVSAQSDSEKTLTGGLYLCAAGSAGGAAIKNTGG